MRHDSNVLHRRSTCRLCGSHSLDLVISLTPTPPANAFVSASELAKVQVLFPLDVFFCRGCGHVQLLHVVNPAVLFEDYVYVSGTSPVFVDHFRRYAEDIVTRFNVPTGAFVIDIGSNDGTLLRCFKQAGMRVLGIDPARKIARTASESGIETLATFFTAEVAREIEKMYGCAWVITANNVLAHADDLEDILQGIRRLLRPEGILVFEVSYLVDVYCKTLFDTIYHEHLSYHTLKPLRDLFSRHGMQIIDAARVDTHGGSLRGIVQAAGGPYEASASVAGLIGLEAELRLDRAGTLKVFSRRIDERRNELRSMVLRLKAEGKRIAGYGAPAKATTLLYHFGFGPGVLDFIVDDSPLKQGLYTPGLHIPVHPSSAIYERKPDYLLLLAWNFAEPIIVKHRPFTEAGGRFIVPLPEVGIR